MSVTERQTSETSIRVELTAGPGTIKCETGDRFLDHMLGVFARYAGVTLDVTGRGDLRHHLVEDVALTLGRAVREIIPRGAARFATRVVPMDDALVQVSVDIGGRPYYEGPLPSHLYDHWMRSFSNQAGATIHIVVMRGRDKHHIVEAAFKALGLALRDALVDVGETVSTKGAISLRVE